MQFRSFNEYGTVSSTLFWLNNNLTVNISLPLSKVYNNIERSIYNDFNYGSNKYYASIDIGWWIKIRYSDKYINAKADYSISSSDMYQFSQAIKTISMWMTNPPNGEKLYNKNADGNLVCISDLGSVKIKNNFGDLLELSPAVYSNATEQSPGVAFIINNHCSIVSIIKFMNLVYMIDHFDPYGMAMSMLNFIATASSTSSSRASNPIDNKKSNVSILTQLGASER